MVCVCRQEEEISALGRDVWVVAEYSDNGLREVSLEILAEGRRLSDVLKTDLAAVLIGWKRDGLADDLIRHGADRVYVVEHELLARYNTDGYSLALAGLAREHCPRLVLMASTPNGSDLAPRVSTRLGMELVTNCTSVKVSKAGALEVARPIYDAKAQRISVFPAADSLIMTFLPGTVEEGKPDRARCGEVMVTRPEIAAEEIRTKVSGCPKADSRTLSLEEAEVVVVGGYGVGSKANWHLVEDLARVLQGSVGGSRMAMDAGWISRDRLVGQTGRSIRPRMCIEIGVSGAVQHMSGLRDCRLIVAINRDKNAPIFKAADVGIATDLLDFVPALIQRLREPGMET